MATYIIILLTALSVLLNINFSGQSAFQTKCLGKYGCFNSGPPFYHPILRPISVLPVDIKDFQTKFYLYTKTKRILIEPTAVSLTKSGYNKDLGLRIFIHGFMMTFNDKNTLAATEAFVTTIKKSNPQNTILVDWSANNQNPYPQAVANGRVVAAQIAELIQVIMDFTNLDPKHIHLVGHSLGCHVSGWVGERIKNIGRITGLDPAGPYFLNSDPTVRLDTSDANFVDIIHTNAADFALQGLGILEPIGHVDFYPNGGTNQPGCDAKQLNVTVAGINIPIVNAKERILSYASELLCNHGRVLNLFFESAKSSSCKFIGYECYNYEKFRWKKCKLNKKIEMGLFAKKDLSISPGSKFYLTTESSEPFCIPS